MSDYRTLDVWKRSHGLVLAVYCLTQHLPDVERYGLVSQARRAAVSIPSNIAEGSGRASDRDYARFLAHAVGSANEREYQLSLINDLGYVPIGAIEPIQRAIAEVRSMVTALRRSLLGARSSPR